MPYNPHSGSRRGPQVHHSPFPTHPYGCPGHGEEFCYDCPTPSPRTRHMPPNRQPGCTCCPPSCFSPRTDDTLCEEHAREERLMNMERSRQILRARELRRAGVLPELPSLEYYMGLAPRRPNIADGANSRPRNPQGHGGRSQPGLPQRDGRAPPPAASRAPTSAAPPSRASARRPPPSEFAGYGAPSMSGGHRGSAAASMHGGRDEAALSQAQRDMAMMGFPEDEDE